MGIDSVLSRTGLSDAKLADHLMVSAETVRLWRNGRRRMSPAHARRIEQDFGIGRHELRPDIYDAPTAERAA